MNLNSKSTKFFLVAITLLSLHARAQQSSSLESSREAMRAAFDACHQELGIERPEPGQRPQAPDDETRQKVEACMKSKGFEMHKFGPGRGGKERGATGVR